MFYEKKVVPKPERAVLTKAATLNGPQPKVKTLQIVKEALRAQEDRYAE